MSGPKLSKISINSLPEPLHRKPRCEEEEEDQEIFYSYDVGKNWTEGAEDEQISESDSKPL